MSEQQPSKYITIFNLLREEILSGKFTDRERFPSEESLVRRFGVSRPTVERALRELKRTGLLESRVGSGFYLSTLARSATGAIGLIVPDYRKIDFFTSLCNDIAHTCHSHGYSVLLGDIESPDPQARGHWVVELAMTCVAKRVAGVIMEPVDLVNSSSDSTQEALLILKKAQIPVILIDRDVEPPPSRSPYDLIGIDNVQAGYRVAMHLLERGARQIRFLTEPKPASTIRQRIQGVAQAVIDAGGEWDRSHVVEINADDDRALRKLFAGKNRPDAVICRNDPLAARVIQLLAKLKIAIPQKVMIAGFDDADFAQYLSPALTSIRQPITLIAEAAATAIFNRIRHPDAPVKSIQLDVELVHRASTDRK